MQTVAVAPTPPSLQPPFDARMDGDTFVAFVDVPGLVEPPTVAFGRDRLVIEGRAGKRTARPFAREIPLPPEIDPDRLELDYIAGVLRINIPTRAQEGR